jgi:hypothetical protein
MQDLLLALAFLAVMLGSALAGMALRERLPSEHLAESSRDSVLRAVGLVVTLSSLVMAFLVSSAKAYYTSVEDELTEISADMAALDRILAHYGPAAGPSRELLRQVVGTGVRTAWPAHQTSLPRYPGHSGLEGIEKMADEIGALRASDGRHAALRNQSLAYLLAIERSGFRLKQIQQARAQTPLLAIIVSWLVIIFGGFGLLTPRNRTALTAMLLAAIAASGALFLIVELYSPVEGLIAIPPSILEDALAF